MPYRLLFALIIALCATAICPTAAQAQNDRRPNIIFLLADDQRADTLGVMGNKIIHTPNIDQLAQHGVTFDNAFVTTAICMTNRACIFTGQYAARHGVVDFKTPFTAEELANTYLGQLKQAGYKTGFIGKWGVGRPPNNQWDYGKGFPGQSHYVQKIDGKTRHLTDIMGDQAVEFLSARKKGEPFVLSVSFKAPHVQDTHDANKDTFIHDPALDHLYKDITIPAPRLAADRYHQALPDFLKDSENRIPLGRALLGPAAVSAVGQGLLPPDQRH